MVGAGAKGHAGVQAHHHLPLPGGVLLPGGADHQTPADGGGVVVVLPGGGPLLLLYGAGVHGVGDGLLVQPGGEVGDGLGGALLRADVDVDDGVAPVLRQQLLVNKVDVGDAGGLLGQVGVVLNVDAVGHHHLGDGGGGVNVLCRDSDLQVGPVH